MAQALAALPVRFSKFESASLPAPSVFCTPAIAGLTVTALAAAT